MMIKFPNLKLRCISKLYCPDMDSGWPHSHAPSTPHWPCHCMHYRPLNPSPCSSTIALWLHAWLVISAIWGSHILASFLQMNWIQSPFYTGMVYSIKMWDLPSWHHIQSFLQWGVRSTSSPCSSTTIEALRAHSWGWYWSRCQCPPPLFSSSVQFCKLHIMDAPVTATSAIPLCPVYSYWPWGWIRWLLCQPHPLIRLPFILPQWQIQHSWQPHTSPITNNFENQTMVSVSLIPFTTGIMASCLRLSWKITWPQYGYSWARSVSPSPCQTCITCIPLEMWSGSSRILSATCRVYTINLLGTLAWFPIIEFATEEITETESNGNAVHPL